MGKTRIDRRGVGPGAQLRALRRWLRRQASIDDGVVFEAKLQILCCWQKLGIIYNKNSKEVKGPLQERKRTE